MTEYQKSEKAKRRAYEDGVWSARHRLNREPPKTLLTTQQRMEWLKGYDAQAQRNQA
jgi:hypothetical protein